MPASAVNYKKKAIEKLNILSPNRLKVVLDFIEYIEQKQDTDEIMEILADEKTLQNIRAADSAWESGRTNEFTSWDKVKRNV